MKEGINNRYRVNTTVYISLLSRPRGAGLATALSSFSGLATNTLNVRNNDDDECSVHSNGGLIPDIMYGHTYSKCMDQPCKVAHPARGQLNRENELFPVRVRA